MRITNVLIISGKHDHSVVKLLGCALSLARVKANLGDLAIPSTYVEHQIGD